MTPISHQCTTAPDSTCHDPEWSRPGRTAAVARAKSENIGPPLVHEQASSTAGTCRSASSMTGSKKLEKNIMPSLIFLWQSQFDRSVSSGRTKYGMRRNFQFFDANMLRKETFPIFYCNWTCRAMRGSQLHLEKRCRSELVSKTLRHWNKRTFDW